ncbi:MAG: TonB-dependent hemoglobin/transferrin/lactoferrin family receptor [Alphaproteobacteria bacterium]|nr:TonB-dependent hemoglobin/transferrin/lactoferrin family receptor [Alphaproteobacteria bacterium]
MPALTSDVEADAPGNATAGDIGDLLEFTPGVEVDGGPRRNGQTVSIRGFDDESIITLIDGRRQNFESAHDGRFFIDPSLLKRVEIVKGSTSSIYGGGAIGGVVAFETKEAADMLEPDERFGVYTAMGYRSGNNEYAPTAAAYGNVDGWDVIGIFGLRHSGDIRQGGGSELETKDRLISGNFKIGYTFNDFNTLKFLYQGSNNDGHEPNNGSGTVSSSNPIVDKRVRDNQFGLKYEFNDPGNNWLKPKAHVYYNDTSVRENDLTGTNAGREQTRELDTIGFTLDNQTALAVSAQHRHTLSYGFEIYRDDQTGETTNGGTRPGVPNADATNYGFYLQDEIALETTLGKFLVIPAARFDVYRSSDDAGNSQSEHQISPKIAASYLPIPNVMVFGSISNAFRAPNLTEIYASGRHFPGIPFVFPDNFFIPNPDLRPESVTTFEVGAGVNFAGIAGANDQVRVKGSWFLSEGDDFITQDVDIAAGTTQNINIPNARLTGFEVDGEYQFLPVTVKLGLSYVKAENRDTGEYLSNNVPLTLVADLSYRAEAIASIFGVRGRFARANNRVGDNDATTAGYSVYDVYYRWTPDWPHLETLTLDLAVSNITDKSYAKRFASLKEEGRSYNVRLAYKW